MELSKNCRCCKKLLPATTEHFYKHPQSKDGLRGDCKECARAETKSHKQKSDSPKGRPNENAFIDYLKSHGVIAHMGAIYKGYKLADVVAWGCVVIELKYYRLKQGEHSYTYHFTPRQQKLNGAGTDIICLATDDNKTISYHFFDMKNPIFYRSGKLKAAVTYNISPTHRSGVPVLLPDMMRMARGNFALIEQKRLNYANQLIAIAQAISTL